MKDLEYKATLQMLVPMVIEIIIERKKISLNDAIKLFYSSILYERMECEKTKLWHLSPLALFDVLETELQTGSPVFPREG